ncbi:hypothetical protein ACC870_37305, partial [Rhizobium ruizarguesonis]
GYQAFWTVANPEATHIWLMLGWAAPHAHNGYRDILLLFLMTVGPKGRFEPRRAAEAIHSSANKAGEVGAKAKAGRDMVKPLGEVQAPAGEHS